MGLVVRGVTKKYGGRGQKLTALDQVDFEVEAGEIVALLGPNGAGKTTLIKTAVGLVLPDEGIIEIDGRSPHRDSSALLSVGAVLEGNRNIYWRLTPLENLIYFGGLRKVPRRNIRKRALQLLEQLGLEAKAFELTHKLSRGMQQKVALAVALFHQPSLLLLDEPTLGLDVEAVVDIKSLVRDLKNEGRAIVLTTHQLDIAQQVSTRVVLINGGRIIASEATPTLLQKHSRNRYEILLDSPLPAEAIRCLRDLSPDIEVDGLQVYLPQDADLFASVVGIVSRYAVRAVTLGDRTLEEVFLLLTSNNREKKEMVTG